MTAVTPPIPGPGKPTPAEPAWEIATLFPSQGNWSETDYLSFVSGKRRLIELVDGRISLLPMPTYIHQLLLQYFYGLLLNLKAGFVVTSGLRIRIRTRTFREPDVLFLLKSNAAFLENEFWQKADIVLEVVSPDKPDRDYVEKRQDYAEAGIAEYWIIDPQQQTVSVLRLDGTAYREYGPFKSGDTAESFVLPQLKISVDHWLEAGRFE